MPFALLTDTELAEMGRGADLGPLDGGPARIVAVPIWTLAMSVIEDSVAPAKAARIRTGCPIRIGVLRTRCPR